MHGHVNVKLVITAFFRQYFSIHLLPSYFLKKATTKCFAVFLDVFLKSQVKINGLRVL